MELREFLRKLPESSTILDVGANVGEFSIAFAIHSKCIVHAIEPGHKVFTELKHRTVGHPRMRYHRLGLSDRNHTDNVFHYHDWTLLPQGHPLQYENTLSGGGYEEFKETTPFTTTFLTLDDFIHYNYIQNPSLIKIDTDGSEPQVIRGGQQTLEKYKPALLIEFGDTMQTVSDMDNPETLLKQLTQIYGYQVRIANPNPQGDPADPGALILGPIAKPEEIIFPALPNTIDLFFSHPEKPI